MRAADYLVTYGAMPVGEMGALESQWPDMSMAQAYECDELRFGPEADEYARLRGHANARAYQGALNEHIRRNGIANPVGIVPAYDTGRFEAGVGNGQHRYFAARDIGVPTLPAGPNRRAPMPLVAGWDYDRDPG
jgi:hypothetical protein